MARFASLHNHSFYSLLDAVMSPSEVVEQAYNFGYKAIALSEHGNMFSFIEGYKKAQELGIRYIPACEIYEADDMLYKEPDQSRYHLILLAKSNKGLQNLFKIVTAGYVDGFYGKPRVSLDLMKKYSDDIICMSSCLGGRINRIMGIEHATQNQFDEAIFWVEKYKEVFGDNYYLEMQSHNTDEQFFANQNLLKLAELTNTKYTITFDTHMRSGSDLQKDIHSKFIRISQDREVGETYTGCYQQSMDEVHTTMDSHIGYEQVEIAITNTEKIAEQCNVTIELHQDLMPHIDIPKQFETEQDYLKYLVQQGWKARGFNKFPKLKQREYRERLEEEFEVLDYLGYCSYFIMLKQFIDKMRERKIPLGYSRGSGGNCLTLYTIGVTEIDSIKWKLDFSRFGNKGRKGSAADYDIDISKFRRQEAIEIAIEMFGVENVSQLATFNSLSPKVCMRDLGKIFHEEGIYNIPYSIRDKIAKLIPDDPNEKMTIQRAMEISPELSKWAEKYPLLFEYTKFLQNLPKSVGCHASAVIVAPRPVSEFAPLMTNKEGNIMMQLEMHNAMDDIGLVKMDFLGLITVDVIQMTLDLTGLTWEDIDINTMDLDDREVFDNIYGKGKTLGIFQMETFTPQRMFKEMDNININDVIAVNALNRPAVLSVGMDRTYIHNKRHPEDAKYLHPDLESIFGETQGIMLYQEQALKVFRLAGFPLDETDVARRAIGKKKADVMAKLFDKFKTGFLNQGWTEQQVTELWNLVEAQSGYSFNCGHSTAYGLLSYVTAYLKYHYPVEFMTALLTSEIGDYGQTTKYINEATQMGIKILPPDINKSNKDYTIDKGCILFGLLSIKGVGEAAVQEILAQRSVAPFFSLSDFYSRCKINTTVNIALIKSGAFGMNKDEILMKYMDLSFMGYKSKDDVKTLPTKAKLKELGLISTDKEFKDKEECLRKYNEYRRKQYAEKEKIKYEKHKVEFANKYMIHPEMYEFETLSIFLQGHPLSGYEEFFTNVEEHEDGDKVLLGGTITQVKNKKQKNGKRMADIHLLTLTGLYEVRLFAHVYADYQDFIVKGQNIIVLAKKSGEQFLAEKIRDVPSWKKYVDNKRKENIAS